MKFRLPLSAVTRSLSARLLVLTVFFVMLAEVFIFAPSIANFRLAWLEERVSAAYLASLALEGRNGFIGDTLRDDLLRQVQALGIVVESPDGKVLILSPEMPPTVDEVIDLRSAMPFGLIVDAFGDLFRSENRILEVRGISPKDMATRVTVILDSTPLRAEMLDFGQRILWLSIIISFFTAVLVYLSLQWLLVAPMRRITASLVAFREDPTSPSAAIDKSTRQDEIGTAQRELAAMQSRLRAALRQKTRLAALGEAVAKINHDLRNMLATARLVSEGLTASDDPSVQRAAGTIERALDRAVSLCAQTLSYARDTADLTPRRFRLADMLLELTGAVPELADGSAHLDIDINPAFEITADRDHLLRALSNLVRNAAEAGATRISVRLVGRSPAVIELRDNGPGMPAEAVENLFRPFRGSVRKGGSGLGLAIANELVEAHGGRLELMETGDSGTVFLLTLPEYGPGSERTSS